MLAEPMTITSALNPRVRQALDRLTAGGDASDAEVRRWQAEQDQLALARQRRELLERSGLSIRHRAASLGDALPDARQAAGALRDLLTHAGVVAMIGPRGTGKTHLGSGFVADACRAGIPGRYASLPQLIVDVKAAWDERGRSEREVLRRYTSAAVLVLDEVHERPGNEWDNRLLTQLVDARYAAERSTVLIANVGRDDLIPTLGSSIASRVRDDVGGVVELTTPVRGTFTPRPLNVGGAR